MTNYTYKTYYNDMISNGYYDLYYWDYIEEVGFHIHRTKNNELVVMKKTKHQIRVTDFKTFLYQYNRYDTLRCVTPDEYFRFPIF